MKYSKIIPDSQDYVWEHYPRLSLFYKWHLVWFLDIFLVSDYLQESSHPVFSKVEAIQRNKSLGHQGIWSSHCNVQLVQQFHLLHISWQFACMTSNCDSREGDGRGAEPWSPCTGRAHGDTTALPKHRLRFMAGSSLSSSSLHSMPLLIIRPKGIWGEEEELKNKKSLWINKHLLRTCNLMGCISSECRNLTATYSEKK